MSSCLNMRLSEPATATAAAAAPTSPSGALLDIGAPYDFRHDVHIRFNYQEARFEGVPDNFCALLGSSSGPGNNPGGGGSSSPFGCASALVSSFQSTGKRSRTSSAMSAAGACSPTEEVLNQQFGVPYRQLPRVPVPGYDDRIPAVLVMLRHHFLAKSGFRASHIFRESPSKADRDQAVRDVNRGAFAPDQHDVRVLADLVKVWFRELPVPILHEIPPQDLQRLAREQYTCGPDDGETGAERLARLVMLRLGTVERSVLLWLADLLALVAAHQEENHMGVDQLAIVIAPNLVRLDCSVGMDDPAAAVALSKAAVDLFRAVLRARFDRRAKDEDKENER